MFVALIADWCMVGGEKRAVVEEAVKVETAYGMNFGRH
jgi:hypothetical protein